MMAGFTSERQILVTRFPFLMIMTLLTWETRPVSNMMHFKLLFKAWKNMLLLLVIFNKSKATTKTKY